MKKDAISKIENLGIFHQKQIVDMIRKHCKDMHINDTQIAETVNTKKYIIMRLFKYTSMIPSLIYRIVVKFRIYSILDIISPRVSYSPTDLYIRVVQIFGEVIKEYEIHDIDQELLQELAANFYHLMQDRQIPYEYDMDIESAILAFLILNKNNYKEIIKIMNDAHAVITAQQKDAPSS